MGCFVVRRQNLASDKDPYKVETLSCAILHFYLFSARLTTESLIIFHSMSMFRCQHDLMRPHPFSVAQLCNSSVFCKFSLAPILSLVLTKILDKFETLASSAIFHYILTYYIRQCLVLTIIFKLCRLNFCHKLA